MNEQQRSTAAGDGSIVEHVIVEPVEPVVGTSRQAFYAVRVSREGDAPDVAIVPEPPHAQEWGRFRWGLLRWRVFAERPSDKAVA